MMVSCVIFFLCFYFIFLFFCLLKTGGLFYSKYRKSKILSLMNSFQFPCLLEHCLHPPVHVPATSVVLVELHVQLCSETDQ